ncbi:metalloprotease C21orf57 [Kickxella alabastrina]|uniref:metalloprotease C21orf57 n=1 Tax=Kickxella alabastrina TaxID=61397 RepID=UPI00221EA597|nr:metalloprotease C21orf57 [Kickxella alabastrina]KAI7828276.1 metalloprotease C21orf57 [Kickxella alabastrina]
MVLLLNNQRAVWLPLRCIKRQIEMLLDCSGYTNWDVGVHFIDNHRMQEINSQYRHKNRPTDILSFPFHQVQGLEPESALPKAEQRDGLGADDERNLGDMFLSLPYILDDCKSHNEKLTDRLPVLFTHGICHLLGYDHELDTDYRLMAEKERHILNMFNQLVEKERRLPF